MRRFTYIGVVFLKVCVYAIAKNEEKFAKRWTESMKEADEIYVLDTGSTDNTVKILEENGVKVFCKKIEPWRFDTARNEALLLVPEDTDICVCTDLDEVFNKGWRINMEKAWKDGTTRLKYRYVWNFYDDGSEGTVFYLEKAHSRKGYKWIYPVHELLISENERISLAKDVQLNHFADKLKSRKQYLPLLELAVQEDPENDRNMHYLAREYMFHRKYSKAIQNFKKHLSLKNSIWKDERCASMRYIAKCYQEIKDYTSAYKYYLMAIGEAPYLREPWIDAALFEYYRQNYIGAIYFIEYALNIKKRTDTYITQSICWDSTPYDILSIAYYRIGNTEKAIENVRKAIELSDDNRLKENLKLYEKATC